MINTIQSICKKHNIDIRKIDMSQGISDIIEDIGYGIINRSIHVDNHRIVMAELWKVERNIEDNILYQNENFQTAIQNILKDVVFMKCNNFLVCEKFIPCSIVQTISETFILNDIQQQKLMDLGYGISNYKIRMGQNIREVYCEGKHPNLDTSSHQFCLDSDFLDLELSKNNISMLEELLSQFNLADCFMPLDEKNKILEIVK